MKASAPLCCNYGSFRMRRLLGACVTCCLVTSSCTTLRLGTGIGGQTADDGYQMLERSVPVGDLRRAMIQLAHFHPFYSCIIRWAKDGTQKPEGANATLSYRAAHPNQLSAVLKSTEG